MAAERTNLLSGHEFERGQTDGRVIEMCLYIAGEAPNSLRALNTLRGLLEKYLKPEQYHLEIIDILEIPLRALQDHILVTPTLLKTAPLPATHIIGDLSDRASVLLALGIQGPDHE